MRLLVLAAFVLVPALLGAEDDSALPKPVLAGRLPKAQLPECSGIVRSPRHEGVYWTINDGGHGAKLFAIGKDGQVLREVPVPGAANTDWEDLALDAAGRLIVADIGDNTRARSEIVLLRLAEPDPHKADAPAEAPAAFRYAYPKDAGPQDAEALIVAEGTAYLFTKESERTRVFAAALPEKPPAETQALRLVAETDAIGSVTAADVQTEAGVTRIALLSYTKVLTFELGQAKESFFKNIRQRRAFLGQAEGICWDVADLLIVCEDGPGVFEGLQIWRIEKAR